MNQKRVIDGRSYSHEVLEYNRFRAIELYKKRKKINDIAEFFGVHRGTVSKWITISKRNGKNALKSKKAIGPSYKLTEKEMKDMIKLLYNDATIYGFETPLWTCQRLKQLIQSKLSKKLHSTNVMRWLKRWGMTNQKPRRRAIQRNERTVKKWLKEEWPKIKEHCRRWQAILYFQDESGVSLHAVMGKTWAPKGQTPIIKTTGKRGGLCVTSAISPAGKMVFRIEKDKERINADKHIEFLQQIMKQHPNRKVVVIEDNAPVHIAKKVDNFVKENKNHIAIYHIPSYSPELNPDEHVWKYLKAYQLKAHQAKNKDEFRNLVRKKMQGIQRKKGLVNSFFVGTYVI